MALFAIIPAAGLSRRMGQPKLLMELAGKTVIEWLLIALDHPAITETIVVFRRNDADLADALAALPFTNLNQVQPQLDPPDMRASVEFGLADVRSRHAPRPDDGWLLIPADHPVHDAGVLDELIQAWQTTDADILIPQHDGKSGHPTFFKWSLTAQIADIPANRGLNWLQTKSDIRVRNVSVASDSILLDLDTPEDYEHLQRRTFKKNN